MAKSQPLEDIKALWDAYDRPTDGTRFHHYKGGEYEIVATGFLENEELPAVVYRSLEKNIVWVRTAENFFETVAVDGQTMPRFVKL